MNYPSLVDSIIFSVGPVDVHWYGLMYVAGFVVCYGLGILRSRRTDLGVVRSDVYDVVFYGLIGAVVGGRIGYTLFYGTELFLANPLWAFKIWEGGMSFHGGMLGALVAFWIVAVRRSWHVLTVADFVAPLVPIGLGLGRIGNYINVELPGRVTESGLGVHFPCWAVNEINPLCVIEWETHTRHLSSLYQAFAEGVVLFLVVWFFSSKPRSRGAVSGLFLITYGLLRIVTELFRQPDPSIGFLAFDALTMGQLLSAPMILAGVLLWHLGSHDGKQAGQPR